MNRESSVNSAPIIDEAAENLPIEEDSSYTSIIVANRVRSVGASVQIDNDEISLRGARNLPDALLQEPSVEVERSPKTGATLEIRGFDEKSVSIFFEGIPIHEVYDGHFDIASLPVFAFDSIQLETGVASILHGPNTAGGIVLMAAPNDCRSTAEISLFGRPFPQNSVINGGAANVCAHLKNIVLWAGVGYERSEGYPLSDSFEETKNNAQYHEDGDIRDGSDYKRTSISFVGKYSHSQHKSLNLFVDAIRSPRGVPPFEGYGYVRYWRFTKYNTLLVGASGVYGPDVPPLSWGFREAKMHLYLHLHRDEIRDYEDATYERLTTNTLAWFVASAYDNDTFGADAESSFSLNRNNRLDLSLRYNFDLHKQREIPVPRNNDEMHWTSWERYAAHTFTAALEDTQEVGPVKLSAGFGFSGMKLLEEEIRDKSYPIHKRLIPGYEGRLSSEYSPRKGIRITAAFGHKIRFPMLKELFSNSIGGNPNLNVERAWKGDIGFESDDRLIKGSETAVHVFGNSIRDLIEKYRDSYANIGHAVIAGVEMEIRYRPIDLLQFYTGYRYLYTRDLDHDRPLDYRTPHRVILGERLFFKFGLTASLEAIFNSGQRAYYVDAVTGDWGEDRLSSFTVLNAHLRYEHEFGEATLYGTVDGMNLFDINYCIGSFEPRAGREIIIGIGSRI